MEQLVGEHVFAELALAALESFAGENAARLATMESARLNIDQKLEQLTSQEQLLRQDQINRRSRGRDLRRPGRRSQAVS